MAACTAVHSRVPACAPSLHQASSSAPCHRTATSERRLLPTYIRCCLLLAPAQAECGDGKPRKVHMRATGRAQRCNTHSGGIRQAGQQQAANNCKHPACDSVGLAMPASLCTHASCKHQHYQHQHPHPHQQPHAASRRWGASPVHDSALHPAGSTATRSGAGTGGTPTHPAYLRQQPLDTVWRHCVPGTCTHAIHQGSQRGTSGTRHLCAWQPRLTRLCTSSVPHCYQDAQRQTTTTGTAPGHA